LPIDGKERDENVPGDGPEAPEDDRPVNAPAVSSTEAGDMQAIVAPTPGADADGAPATETSAGALDHPFAARGAAPPGITITQEDLPDYPDNLPPADPPKQRLPAWILDLEQALP
jgi:hypothetical protein